MNMNMSWNPGGLQNINVQGKVEEMVIDMRLLIWLSNLLFHHHILKLLV